MEVEPETPEIAASGLEMRADPGAVQFGNFINYYQFHPPDERIRLLPGDVWQETASGGGGEPYLLLDVGCNAGNLTQLLWQHVSQNAGREVHVLGIDIDPMLIERSEESNTQPDQISYACVDVMNPDEWPRVEEFLERHKRQRFDAVCCFSITMWIHLNHGDDGLRHFLAKLADKAQLFVVEPQPWKCYKTAQRRMGKGGDAFPLMDQLKWTLDVNERIEDYMENVLRRRKVYESSPTKWKRKICFYRSGKGTI